MRLWRGRAVGRRVSESEPSLFEEGTSEVAQCARRGEGVGGRAEEETRTGSLTRRTCNRRPLTASDLRSQLASSSSSAISQLLLVSTLR